mmetsp:Transcript_44837/g.83724  ORF Transcript_44837/g.83724 Transcript_44837/m.83724 type:complete len:250 (+) Transcript_44837:105-854(+)
MSDTAPAIPQGGGILGRFENVRVKKSSKKTVTCDAATPEYLRHDFLKPQHLPIERVDEEANFIATSNINETRFHKGFHRRHQADIQQDAARLEHEAARENARQDRAIAQATAAQQFRSKCTFNILTGEGLGRECEFRQVGKKILNPYGSMQATFSEHDKEERHRVKNSKHRFFEHPSPEKEVRTANLFNEGLRQTVRESAVLGYGRSGVARTRARSCGVADNFVHLQALPPEPDYEVPRNGNASQIILG